MNKAQNILKETSFITVIKNKQKSMFHIRSQSMLSFKAIRRDKECNRTTDPGQSTVIQTFSPCVLYAATLNCLLPINPATKIKKASAFHASPLCSSCHNAKSTLSASIQYFLQQDGVGVSRGSVHSNSFMAQLGNWSKKLKHTHQVPVHVKHTTLY